MHASVTQSSNAEHITCTECPRGYLPTLHCPIQAYAVLCCVVLCCAVQASGDEPVWLQLLQDQVNHEDPAVSQQAAAALAEIDNLGQ